MPGRKLKAKAAVEVPGDPHPLPKPAPPPRSTHQPTKELVDEYVKVVGVENVAGTGIQVLDRGGAQKKIRGITFFSYPPPLGGVQPEKKYPTPMCKKVSQPHFFSKEHHWLLFHIV